MTMNAEQIRQMIEAALPGARIDVKDTRGDGDHFAAIVESPSFAGKTRVQQHQMVYAALEGKTGLPHALALTTIIPQE
ncbi:MAG: BolA/IbaG family iron-sulfur metabolism protein [Alphaproteobacteria bacterium]